MGIKGFTLGNYILNVIGAKVFILKSFVLVFVQIWVRWTLPRLRIDQVMTCCLKYLVPISCFLFLGATVWPLVLAASLKQTTWTAPLGPKGLPRQVAPANPGPRVAVTAETGAGR
jgi:NADH-quinone oxidoreductase subunit H